MTIDQLSAEPDLEYTPIVVPLPALVRREELDALRADLDLCLGYLDAVLDGMTVQELAALGDALDAVRERWGLGEVQR